MCLPINSDIGTCACWVQESLLQGYHPFSNVVLMHDLMPEDLPTSAAFGNYVQRQTPCMGTSDDNPWLLESSICKEHSSMTFIFFLLQSVLGKCEDATYRNLTMAAIYVVVTRSLSPRELLCVHPTNSCLHLST